MILFGLVYTTIYWASIQSVLYGTGRNNRGGVVNLEPSPDFLTNRGCRRGSTTWFDWQWHVGMVLRNLFQSSLSMSQMQPFTGLSSKCSYGTGRNNRGGVVNLESPDFLTNRGCRRGSITWFNWGSGMLGMVLRNLFQSSMSQMYGQPFTLSSSSVIGLLDHFRNRLRRICTLLQILALLLGSWCTYSVVVHWSDWPVAILSTTSSPCNNNNNNGDNNDCDVQVVAGRKPLVEEFRDDEARWDW
jgi:hypothetical protein